MGWVIRRRWSDCELADAKWRGGRLASARKPGMELIACVPLVKSIPGVGALLSNDGTALRFSLTGVLTVVDLSDLSRAVNREAAVVRCGSGRLYLIVGADLHLPLLLSDELLVHSHVYDLPPSGWSGGQSGDILDARRFQVRTQLAVVGPDGRVTDYDSTGLTPDTEWSYVADDGTIDGRRHRVFVPPPRAWSSRDNRSYASGHLPESSSRYYLAARASVNAFLVTCFVGEYCITFLLVGLFSRKMWRFLISRRLTGYLEMLGPLWVKLGQIASSRRDLFPDDVIQSLSKLQTQVTSQWNSAITIDRSCNEKRCDGLEVEPAPSFSGSVAQVFKGRLADGSAVAVKVIRRNAAKKIEADIRILSAAGRILKRFRPFRFLPILEFFKDIGIYLQDQCDLRKEADNIHKFRAAFSDSNSVLIPKVYDGFRAKTMLVLEYFRPETLRHLGSIVSQTHLAKDAARTILHTTYRMIFELGLVHTDMHPGNLVVFEDGRIVLFDFGLTAEIDDQTKKDFADLFLAMATRDHSNVARVLYETALARPNNLDLNSFELGIQSVAEEHHGRLVRDFEVSEYVYGLMRVMRVHKLVATTMFTRILVALLTCEAALKTLNPLIDFQGEAVAFIGRLRQREQGRTSPPHVSAPLIGGVRR